MTWSWLVSPGWTALKKVFWENFDANFVRGQLLSIMFSFILCVTKNDVAVAFFLHHPVQPELHSLF